MEGARVLVVSSDPQMLEVLRTILESEDYRVDSATNGADASTALQLTRPDLVLSDLSPSASDGVMLLEAVCDRPNGGAIPFIQVIARGAREDVFAAKAKGVDDFIDKPVTRHSLLGAVRARLQRPDEPTQMQLQRMAVLRVLANAMVSRDPHLRLHAEAVSEYTCLIATELGWRDRELAVLESGALLHDIGKIGLAHSVLFNPGTLNQDEQEEMRRHPVYGAHMIQGTSPFEAAVPLVLHHHERWDGAGYPDHLAGEAIPIGARLIAVADAFANLTADAPHRTARSMEDAFEGIVTGAGSQFDPSVVDAFSRCWQRGEVQRIYTALRSSPDAHPRATPGSKLPAETMGPSKGQQSTPREDVLRPIPDQALIELRNTTRDLLRDLENLHSAAMQQSVPGGAPENLAAIISETMSILRRMSRLMD